MFVMSTLLTLVILVTCSTTMGWVGVGVRVGVGGDGGDGGDSGDDGGDRSVRIGVKRVTIVGGVGSVNGVATPVGVGVGGSQ
jgi:hypothetical protein